MAVLVGIDEAGYGPLLGPLVVSSVGFDVPDKFLKNDMWELLADSVAKERGKLKGRLLINDSKQAYNKTIGIKHLQRTTLASLKTLSKVPQTHCDLLRELCPDCRKRLDAYAWYQGLERRFLEVDAGDIAIAADVFARNLCKHGLKLLWLKSICLDVAHYNKLVDACRNKASVLFTTACTLMEHARSFQTDKTVQIVVDRQGGRADYTMGLRRMFPDTELKVIRQDETDSSYELTHAAGVMKVHFVVGADERFLPVALASMACKYVRELLNESMNDYFVKLSPQLKPTAGYWKDGTRFVQDLKQVLPDLAYDASQLIRSR